MRFATCTKTVAALTAAMLALACGGSQNPAAESGGKGKQAKGKKEAPADPRCPMVVKEVEVAAAPIAYGAELSFSTESGSVEKLRSRAQLVAEAYNSGGVVEGDVEGAGGEPFYWPTPTFEMEAEFEETDSGGRVKVTAADSGDADKLREHMEKLAAEMRRSGTCPDDI